MSGVGGDVGQYPAGLASDSIFGVLQIVKQDLNEIVVDHLLGEGVRASGVVAQNSQTGGDLVSQRVVPAPLDDKG